MTDLELQELEEIEYMLDTFKNQSAKILFNCGQMTRMVIAVRRLYDFKQAVQTQYTDWKDAYIDSQNAIQAIGKLLSPPSVSDIVGIAPDITNGIPSDQYVRKIRDEQEDSDERD